MFTVSAVAALAQEEERFRQNTDVVKEKSWGLPDIQVKATIRYSGWGITCLGMESSLSQFGQGKARHVANKVDD